MESIFKCVLLLDMQSKKGRVQMFVAPQDATRSEERRVGKEC